MSRRDAWRGERRLRVGLRLSDGSAQVVSMWVLDGPAVQRPSLSGRYVARVEVGGAVALVQAFEEPSLIRGIAPPEQIGHSYTSGEPATINIDIPFSKAASLKRASIRLADLSRLSDRPTDPAAVSELFDTQPPGMRELHRVSAKQLATHPEWPASAINDDLPGDVRKRPRGVLAPWLRGLFKKLGRR
jgi:hypothetical protein